MVSRHFYEIDEVVAAFRWCMRQGRVQESLFWATELLESELQDTLQDELYKSWLWCFGIGCLSALSHLQDEPILQTVFGLARLSKEKRDRSILALLIYGSIDYQEPDRASYFPDLEAFFQEYNCSDLEKAFLSATYQGKSRLAFDLSRPLWQESSSRVYTLLQSLQNIKYKSDELAECLTLLQFNEHLDIWGSRACAVAAICLDSKRMKQSLKPIELTLSIDMQKTLTEWKEMVGRRRRRHYGIPFESLYYITKRGRLSNKISTLEKLYAISDTTLNECPFWERVLEEEAPWLDDDRKEAFYELYFPDDIPDEWSKKDQEKSHGWCCLINQEVPNYNKYINRWYRDLPARSYWFTNCDVIQFEKELNLDQPWAEVVSTWCLTPVKKRILVLANDV